ncbi:hypothetical protein V500_05489 [Pseudogymnoascus sp. VKM F-4518 (FW-2643)]|nr:hypothetical protein V500_05489 [Pseudogymnoascus sp. VKM F-4518 (FW-2643)]
MVATAKQYSANSDDEPLYENTCIVSTCNKPILQWDSSDEVCISCKQAAKNATTKLKARRLKPKKAETGLWTPQSEASSKNGCGGDALIRQKFSPLPPMMDPNDKGKKRKLGDTHSATDETKNWRSHKSRKVGGITEGNVETDFADQRSKAGTIGGQELRVSSDHVGNAPQLPTRAESVEDSTGKDARRTGIVPPLSMITRSRSIINSEAVKSTGTSALSPPGSPFQSIFPDIQIPHSKPSFSDGRIPLPKPINEVHKSAGNPPLPAAVLPVPAGSLPLSEGSPVPEDSFLLSKDSPLLSDDSLSLLGGSLLLESPHSMSEGSPIPDDPLFLSDDTPLAPEHSQHATNNVSTDSTNQGPENTYKSRDYQLTKPSSMRCNGSNMPSTPQSTSPTDTALKRPAKAPMVPSDDRDFTDNGDVQFQPFVPFIGVSLDSIEPTLNPNSVQARRSKNILGTEPDSLGFYNMLSKYRGSDEEFMAQTLFDLRTEDESYISIQAKIAARGGRKRQFGEVCSRLDVDSTWNKHQNQPWKINPAGLNRDDLPLQKMFGEFKVNDMVPTVVEGELHLTQHEEYEGPRRTWRYGDGGTGKGQGYPEAQAGAWAHLAKPAI